jgi:hypothetical protein
MPQTYMLVVLTAILCLSMICFQEVGRKIGFRRLKRDPDTGLHGAGDIEAGLFAIWGLLIAFTFSGAASRFDLRRSLVGQETNAIRTAYSRLAFLSKEDGERLRAKFRSYLEKRLEAYERSEDKSAWKDALARSVGLQNEIWNDAVEASRRAEDPKAGPLLLPAINSMIEITTTRLVAIQMHPPFIVYIMLLVLSLLCATMVGFSQANGKYRHSLHISGFIMITTLITYVILDMEFPRLGIIRVDKIDQFLVELLNSMK